MAKVILVTGANQGLGYALVKGFCSLMGNDDTVLLGALDKEKGEAVVESIGHTKANLLCVYLDLTEPASIQSLARYVENNFSGIDIVINNAAAKITKGRSQAEQVQNNDMSAAQSPEQAAKDIIWLARTAPDAALPKGELVQFHKVLPWDAAPP